MVKRIAKPKQSSKTSSGPATASAPAPPGHAPAPPPADVRSTAVVKLEKPDKPARTNCETTDKQKEQRNFKANFSAAKSRMASCITCVGKSPEEFCKKCTRDYNVVQANELYSKGSASVKDKILGLYKQDKNAAFVNEFFKESADEDRTTEGTKGGWISRFDVADLCKFDIKNKEHSELLDQLLETLESDTNWDEDIAFEKFMKAKGEKRYKFDKQMVNKRQKISSSTDREIGKLNKTGKLSLADVEEGVQSSTITMINAEMVEAKRFLMVITSGNKQVVSLLAQLKSLKSKIGVCKSEDRHQHIADLQKAIKALEESEEKSLDKIATANAGFDAMADEELTGWSDAAKEYIAEINTHIEAAKEMKRTKSGWINAEM